MFEVWLSLVEYYVRDVGAAGSNPVTSTILVEQKRYPPFKARIYGLFWHFRGEKFIVKTVDAFQGFSRTKGIRTDAKENFGETQGRFKQNNLKSAFF